MHNKFNLEKELKIQTLFDSGLNPTEIAKKLGTYNTTIRRVLLRRGNTLKGISDTLKLVKGNPFTDNWETGGAYWTGFIAADGNIYENRIKVGLSPLDKNHLKSYLSFLDSGIKLLQESNPKGMTSCVVSFKSKSLAKWFTSVGITANKSKTIKVKDSIIG